MGLEVYYPQDIRNALFAAKQASASALRANGNADEFTQGYQAGYEAALTTIALAFGLVQVQGRERVSLQVDWPMVLEAVKMIGNGWMDESALLGECG